MTNSDIGPRRRALLEGWGNLLTSEAEGDDFDCSATNRTASTQDAVERFLGEPTEERFRVLWRRNVLADSVIGGPELVLKRHESIEDLNELIVEIRNATEYDDGWVGGFATRWVVWELYGRLHPESEPIVYSNTASALTKLGFSQPSTYCDVEEVWPAFRSIYQSIVGHATAGTGHEVPLHHEMSEFLRFIAPANDEPRRVILQEYTDEYLPLAGWQDEAPLEQDLRLAGHMEHVRGYCEAERLGGFEENPRTDLWNKGFWEDWKDGYLSHIEAAVRPRYDVTELTAEEIGPFLDALTQRIDGVQLPTYLLGGRSGGINWSKFRSHSTQHPAEAAAVLSYLFDEDIDLTRRLDRFVEFYRSMDVSGGGAFMTISSTLLSAIYPGDYVPYKWGLMNRFFGEYARFHVDQGFNPRQYWKLNLACKNQLLGELERGLAEKEPTMLDVYTLLYVWDRNHRGQ